MIEYKGYFGTVEFDPKDHNLWGKVINTSDDLFYEGDSVAELEESMHGAIDNYLAHCEEIGKTPRKAFSGKIALRVDPGVHARLAAKAETAGVSMNQLIVDALDKAG